MLAATNGNPAVGASCCSIAVRTPPFGSKRNETALGNAATAGVEETVKLLLDHGADVNVRNIRGFSPLMLAASSDTMPAGVVKLLLAKGRRDRAITGDYDETARDLAAKRGDTDAHSLASRQPHARLPSMPAREAGSRSPLPSIADAVEKSMVLLEKQSYNFIRIGGCNSCHSQDLVSAAAAFARSRGLKAPAEIAAAPGDDDATCRARHGFERRLGYRTQLGVVRLWHERRAGECVTPICRCATDQSESNHRGALVHERKPAAADEHRRLSGHGPGNSRAQSLHTGTRARLVSRRNGERGAWLETEQPQTTQDRAFHALALAWANAPETPPRNRHAP